MKKLICFLFAAASSAAFAKSSVCVLYVDGSSSPVQSQYSCDGADLQNLYQASGITAALSKSIPYFIDQGYDYAGCTDSAVDGSNNTGGTAFSRCVFIKKNASTDLVLN